MDSDDSPQYFATADPPYGGPDGDAIGDDVGYGDLCSNDTGGDADDD